MRPELEQTGRAAVPPGAANGSPDGHDVPNAQSVTDDLHAPLAKRVWERTLTRRLMGASIVIAAAALTFAYCRTLPSPHLTVELHNDTGAPMTDVHFVFGDGKGKRASQEVAAEGMVAWGVTGESRGFSIDYRDPDGRLVTRTCDLFFDGDDWGTMSIRVKQGGLKVLTEVEVPKDGSR